MPNLINRAACRDLALRWSRDHRKGWTATRVSKQFLDDLETKVMVLIQNAVNKHRTVGKTIADFF
jgi:hypothetical protein